MQIHTTARHFELDPGVRRYAEERIGRFGKFARDLREAHLVVTAEGYRHTAEITIQVNGREFASREESTEAEVAIDLAASHIETQLRKLKEIRVDRRRGRVTGGNGKALVNGAAEPEDEEAEQLRALGIDADELELPEGEEEGR